MTFWAHQKEEEKKGIVSDMMDIPNTIMENARIMLYVHEKYLRYSVGIQMKPFSWLWIEM